MFIGPQLSLQRPEKMRFRMQMYSILYSFRNSLSVTPGRLSSSWTFSKSTGSWTSSAVIFSGKNSLYKLSSSMSGTGPSGSIPSSRPFAATSLTECFEMCHDEAMLLCEAFLISSSRILRTLIFLAILASLELISAANKGN